LTPDEMHDEVYMQDRAARNTPWDEKAFSRKFSHEVATVNGNVRIHYVVGGEGPLLVLLHGFPQHWREWRLMMPALLDAGYTVVAPDLRGFGQSDKPLDGFDVRTVSEYIRELMRQFDRQGVNLVGNGVGASVAYAWAAGYPDEVQRLVMIEAFPAGLEPPSATTPTSMGKPMWHLALGSTPDVPEALLAGRERVLVEFLFRQDRKGVV